MEENIEIHDPEIDAAALCARIQRQVQLRRASGNYDAALSRLAEVPPVTPLKPNGSEFPWLRQAVLDLTADCYLSETSFQSYVPVVGPVIVAIRRAWNWMSTKWYVRPLIGQQSTINARTSTLIGEMVQWAEITARQNAELQRQIADLEARVTELERR